MNKSRLNINRTDGIKSIGYDIILIYNTSMTEAIFFFSFSILPYMHQYQQNCTSFAFYSWNLRTLLWLAFSSIVISRYKRLYGGREKARISLFCITFFIQSL